MAQLDRYQFSSSSSRVDLRSWASSRLPKLIVFALGLHLLFSLILINVLHDHHEQLGRVLVPIHNNNRNNNNDLYYDEREVSVKDDYRKYLLQTSQELKSKLDATLVKSCRWRIGESAMYSENCNYVLEKSSIEDAEAAIVLYNPLNHERILCDGTKIGPRSIRFLSSDEEASSCSTETPQLFPVVPTLDNSDKMDPIQLTFGDRKSKLQDFPCDVPCQSTPGARTVGRRQVLDTPWSLTFSMEGPKYYSSLLIDERAHLFDKYYSTTSFQSEVPLPYFSWDEYGSKIQADPVEYDQAIKGAVFMANNCNSRNNREGLVMDLINSTFRVDSVSKCLHNAPKPKDSKDDKVQILRNYLFYLGFENQCVDDYITEKLWLTYAAGVVPIYYGAPNVLDHVPPHSLIDANEYATTDELIQYLNKVANNQTLYESYHAWRKKPLPESFVEKYNFTHIHSTCRTCRWAFAKQYGLGWNHQTQSIKDLKIPRKVCYESNGLLTHPFRESWLSTDGSDYILLSTGDGTEPSTCDTTDTALSMPLWLSHTKIQRRIVSKDGVVDIYLDGIHGNPVKGNNIVLQMETDIEGNSLSALLTPFSDQHFRFQDSTRRMTIVSDRSIGVYNTEAGVVELAISNINDPIRIRVIIEDIDAFYKGGNDQTNYFGQLMVQDFFNPLEKFVVWGSSILKDDPDALSDIRLESKVTINDQDSEYQYPNALQEVATGIKKNITATEKERVTDVKENLMFTEKKRLIQIKQDKPNGAATRKAFKKLIESGAIKVHQVEESASKKS